MHASAAIVITIGVVLHIGGVYKHAAFDQDGTFGKMLMPSAKRATGPDPVRTE